MRSLTSYLGHTIRRLAKSPGFTVTAVLILGLGIGANTAIFSLISGVLLKPLPYPHPERLVNVFETFANLDRANINYRDYLDYSANQHSFDALTIFREEDFNLSGRGEPVRISGLYVSGSFFHVLGRPFLIGHPFGEADDKPDAPGVVVLSEHLWRTQFRSDANLLGGDLLLNGRRFQVIGITPAQGNEGRPVDLYVPVSQAPFFGTTLTTTRGGHSFSSIGRLKPDTSIQQALADLQVTRQNLADSYPQTNKAFGIRLFPYLDSVMTDYSTTLWLLEAAVACLLLITCANVGNLLLARTRERRKEITIRAALGAGRFRLAIELLLESLVLAVAGGCIGLLLSYWAVDAIRGLAPRDISRFQDITVDAGALIFVLAVTFFAALFSGLAPALMNSRISLGSALKREGDRGDTSGRERNRTQSFLVTGQIALTSILLIGAGLMARSFQALQSAPLGFKPDHVLTANFYLADTKYKTQADCDVFFDAILSKVSRLPGVTSASLNSNLPFAGNHNINGFGIAGQPDPDLSQVPLLEAEYVSNDYFSTVGVPLIKGRFFRAQDNAENQKGVIVSEGLARRYFPNQDPVGKQITDLRDLVGLKRNIYTIIGVVGDVLPENPEFQVTPFQAYYTPAQNPSPTDPVNGGTLIIRTERDPESLVAPLKKIVAELDPNLPLYKIDLFDDLVARAFATKRLATTVVSLFSGTALLLAGVGLYGVLSYAVARRKREIGVRMALGAESIRILHLVFKQGLILVAVGLLIGLSAALTLSRLITSILYGVSATDLVSIVLSALILGLVAVIACLLPAFRATRIDPITALRE
jgi:putative ABC transport system permease protein